MIFLRNIVIFHTKSPNIFRASIILSAPRLTWNPGSAPDLIFTFLISLFHNISTGIQILAISRRHKVSNAFEK